MARAFLFVLDSFGIGHAHDAETFGDAGASTYEHIAAHFDRAGAPLELPNLRSLGLDHAQALAKGQERDDVSSLVRGAVFAAASEVSRGKDTPSGHWEIAGLPVLFDWGYFPHEIPAFPEPLLEAICHDACLSGSLGNKHASGTQVLAELGEEHLRTGQPIFYTSTDSVFQIAAHEEAFGLQRLYDLCEMVKAHTDPLNIGRVIARPFLGSDASSFERTGNRRDFAIPPHGPTLLDHVCDAGNRVLAVGKIDDIFAHRGVSQVLKANGNAAIGDAALTAMAETGDGDLVFANFVDFDMLYGHRRNWRGYGEALEAFDRRLPEFMAAMGEGDLLVITADHGCDPTWEGTDHTREQVPVLAWAPGDAAPASGGRRASFSDIGQTIAAHLGCAPLAHGTAIGALNSVHA